MGAIKDTLDALGITLVNFLRKPITVMYPREKRTIPERFRGILALTKNPDTGEENCIGCRLCEMICPSHIIKVVPEKKEKRMYAKSFELNMQACMFCELCVQVCPTDAIVMRRASELAVFNKEELIFDKEKLLKNLELYPESWATGNHLRKAQSPPRRRVIPPKTQEEKQDR